MPNAWRDQTDRFQAEPCSGMPAETWKAFCLTIANMQGYTPQAEKPRIIGEFVCQKCGMKWTTGIELAGSPHRATENECGGTWKAADQARETSAPGQPGSVVEAGSPVKPTTRKRRGG